jgi:DNA-binding winged helix-turn-helix (wHTH) protein
MFLLPLDHKADVKDNLMLRFILCFLIFNSIVSLGHTTPDDDVTINIAIRKAIDQLLRSEGDSTSKISPVSQKGNSFELKINGSFNYDKLPMFMSQSFKNIGINKPYNVSIMNCADDIILLGYNSQDASDGAVACKGRAVDIVACHRVSVMFNDTVQKTNYNYLFFIAPIALIALMWTKLRKHSIASLQDDEELQDYNIITIGRSKLDQTRLTIEADGQKSSLTHLEAQLLSYLYDNIGKIIERDTITLHVWNDDSQKISRSLDVFISRLRKKLSHDPSIQIIAVHGIGYKMDVVSEL